jgi:hypothetical protein
MLLICHDPGNRTTLPINPSMSKRMFHQKNQLEIIFSLSMVSSFCFESIGSKKILTVSWQLTILNSLLVHVVNNFEQSVGITKTILNSPLWQ